MIRLAGMILIPFITSLIGCAGSSALLEGEDRLVRYEQFDKDTGALDLELVLVEERRGGYREIYSEERDEANVKQVPAPVFEELVRSLEDLDFLEMAARQKSGVEAQRKDIKKRITVENELGQWTCVNPTDLACGKDYIFGFMDQRVRDCFNRVLALQSVTNKEGGELFYREQRRLKEEVEHVQ